MEQKQSKIEIIKNAMSLFSKINLSTEDIDEFFTNDYIQNVDGNILKKEEFVKHVQLLNNLIDTIHFDFEHVVEKDNYVATVHYATVKKKDGTKSKTKVIAIFGFKNGKISSCNELTELIHGSKGDHNLGSRL